ncbi:PREDICTED: RNA polymerase II degradation factor 1-like, partial [Eufriesea mexicana]
APAQIQQLLHAQNSRPPIIPVPSQPVPKLGSNQPAQPQQVSQTQVSQYRPQVTFASGVQQPDYRGIPASRGQGHPAQAPQYRPLPQPNYNAAPQPQYQSKLPPHIQQLLQFQSSLGNSIPGRS